MKHRAICIGAGRISAGFNWIQTPYVYTHADAYLALKERVELIGFVEPDPERAAFAEKKYGLKVWKSLVEVDPVSFDIASVCTQPDIQKPILDALFRAGTRGIWCEKPYRGSSNPQCPVQVNYIRRADTTHRLIAECLRGKKSDLFVWARNDETTRCHFEDLAYWWGSTLHYCDNTGEVPSTNSYRVDTGKWSMESRNGGVEGGFMETMLTNLLDVVDGLPANLLSPAR